MNTKKLILIGAVPLLAGLLRNAVVNLPVVGGLLMALIPWVMAVFWIMAGHRVGQSQRSPFSSLALAHWSTLLCVLCAIWQAGFVPNESHISFFYTLAQLPVGLIPGVIGLVMPLAQEGNVISGNSMVLWGAPVTGLALVLLFALGFFLGRNAKKAHAVK